MKNKERKQNITLWKSGRADNHELPHADRSRIKGSRVRCGSQICQGDAPMALEEHTQDHRHRI